MSRARTERLVNLVICLLATRRFLTAAQIAATVPGYEHDRDDPKAHEAFQRKLERDKAELRARRTTGDRHRQRVRPARLPIARREYVADISLSQTRPRGGIAASVAARRAGRGRLSGLLRAAGTKSTHRPPWVEPQTADACSDPW